MSAKAKQKTKRYRVRGIVTTTDEIEQVCLATSKDEAKQNIQRNIEIQMQRGAPLGLIKGTRKTEFAASTVEET